MLIGFVYRLLDAALASTYFGGKPCCRPHLAWWCWTAMLWLNAHENMHHFYSLILTLKMQTERSKVLGRQPNLCSPVPGQMGAHWRTLYPLCYKSDFDF